MRLLDSRRLTGPTWLLDRPGAVLDLELEPAVREAAIAAWQRSVRALLAAVGWGGETLRVRRFECGASVAFTAGRTE